MGAPARRSTLTVSRSNVRGPMARAATNWRNCDNALDIGDRNTTRSDGIPSQSAAAVAIAPAEWATTAWGGPYWPTTRCSVAVNSGKVAERGPEAPGAESPWLGMSKATAMNPWATSGSTNAAN
jgi:hypothetical protein